MVPLRAAGVLFDDRGMLGNRWDDLDGATSATNDCLGFNQLSLERKKNNSDLRLVFRCNPHHAAIVRCGIQDP